MTDPNLVSVAYCYVVNLLYPHPAPPSIRLPPNGYSASFTLHQRRPSHFRTGSSAYLDFPRLRPSILLIHRLTTMGSSAHLSIACLKYLFPVYSRPFVFACSLLIYPPSTPAVFLSPLLPCVFRNLFNVALN